MTLLPSTDATARVLALLPAHVRARDAESGGLIAALAEAIGGELDVLERDIDALYASWFVETCPEWVVPYLADLVGVADLPPDLPGVTSRRAFVANTVRYRQGKGTVAVVEQVARDASGWPAKAVEFYRLLATTAHVNHVRTDRPATATIRTPVDRAGPLELVPAAVAQGALHGVAHTAEVRRIASGRGRYGIRERRRLPLPATRSTSSAGRRRRRPRPTRAGRCTRSGGRPRCSRRPLVEGDDRAPRDGGGPAGAAAAAAAPRAAGRGPEGRGDRIGAPARRAAGRGPRRRRRAWTPSGSACTRPGEPRAPARPGIRWTAGRWW